MIKKSSTAEIRARFDADVERFSNLETGQAATIDAPLAMELITTAAMAANPHPRRILDIGCGAGNNAIALTHLCPEVDCDLVDLSAPMLERAYERLQPMCRGRIQTFQGDIRDLSLPEEQYDVILAAAVLHHLREDADWEHVFSKIYALCSPGGYVWITDLVTHEIAAVHSLMWQRYGDYLQGLGGPEYQQTVFDYIEIEDSPRPLTWQLDLLRRVGFTQVEVLHKNSCFAAFGAVKG